MNTSTRFDGFTFYSLTAISFLESAVANYVDNLQPYFGNNPEAALWLQDTWLPEEFEHGRLTREFVERNWPEFEWGAAYAQFLKAYVPRCSHTLLRPSPAMEALARCVTETEAAMIYRTLSVYTMDPQLQSMLARMSKDEVRHYSYFRRLFDNIEASEKNSFLRKAKIVLSRSELVRDEDLALAFSPINEAWHQPMPFKPFSYREFLTQASQVMTRHFPVEAAKRMLFRPLLTGRVWEKWATEILALAVRKQYAI